MVKQALNGKNRQKSSTFQRNSLIKVRLTFFSANAGFIIRIVIITQLKLQKSEKSIYSHVL